jgi:hypothetical protein
VCICAFAAARYGSPIAFIAVLRGESLQVCAVSDADGPGLTGQADSTSRTFCFKVRNLGEAAVRITGYSPSCDCLYARPDLPVTIEASKTQLFWVALQPGREADPEQTAKRQVLLFTNNPRQPEVTLRVAENRTY